MLSKKSLSMFNRSSRYREVYYACLLERFFNFCVCPSPFSFEGGKWYVIVLIPEDCLSIYFVLPTVKKLRGACILV